MNNKTEVPLIDKAWNKLLWNNTLDVGLKYISIEIKAQ